MDHQEIEKTGIPDFLYHYTNIDKLAMILEEKKIRFGNLRFLDDVEEGITSDKNQYAKYCFASSWTDEQDESIPMWKMYNENMNGVRIGLPSNLFPTYKISKDELSKEFVRAGCDPKKYQFDSSVKSPVPLREFFSGTYNFSPSMFHGIELIQVNYSKEDKVIIPQITSVRDDGKLQVILGEIGRNKRECWNFQREWRYIIRIYPFSFIDLWGWGNLSLMRYNAAVNGCPELPEDIRMGYLVSCDNVKFSKMEIVLGPKMNEGHKNIVKLLADKYCPTATIKESNLLGKIR